jgi:hypothetical protein
VDNDNRLVTNVSQQRKILYDAGTELAVEYRFPRRQVVSAQCAIDAPSEQQILSRI